MRHISERLVVLGSMLSAFAAEAASTSSAGHAAPDWHRAGVCAAALLFLAARRLRRV